MNKVQNELTPANQLCFSIYHASRLFVKRYQHALRSFSLTHPQYLVLLNLWENDQQPLHDLGRRLDFGSNTLTPLLKRMEINGWLTRQPLSSDRRQLIIVLTEQGRERKAEILSAIKQLMQAQAIDTAVYHDALHQTHAFAQLEKGLDVD